MGPPGNRGSWGPCVLAQTQKSLQITCNLRRNAVRFLCESHAMYRTALV
ncbi:unnamed protein product [Staurois parvus]|uniref:Uncharacterized protein n=1 Tax=Staurois parvus TaxID=386267 RepID=A0ABN9H2I0_9NEOB|nr:unnamed protein product [Staurois parvus]